MLFSRIALNSCKQRREIAEDEKSHSLEVWHILRPTRAVHTPTRSVGWGIEEHRSLVTAGRCRPLCASVAAPLPDADQGNSFTKPPGAARRGGGRKLVANQRVCTMALILPLLPHVLVRKIGPNVSVGPVTRHPDANARVLERSTVSQYSRWRLLPVRRPDSRMRPKINRPVQLPASCPPSLRAERNCLPGESSWAAPRKYGSAPVLLDSLSEKNAGSTPRDRKNRRRRVPGWWMGILGCLSPLSPGARPPSKADTSEDSRFLRAPAKFSGQIAIRPKLLRG